MNLLHSPILSDKQYSDIAHVMKSRMNTPNRLKAVVEHYNLPQVKAPYIDINYSALDNAENNEKIGFPQLSLEDLYYVRLGPYQINNAASYYAEHKEEGIFLVKKFSPPEKHQSASLDYSKFEIQVSEPMLLKVYMKSRYRNGKHHHIFVLIDKGNAGRESIIEYFYTCESGARTVGCCIVVML